MSGSCSVAIQSCWKDVPHTEGVHRDFRDDVAAITLKHEATFAQPATEFGAARAVMCGAFGG